MDKEIQYIKDNFESLCNEETFVGIGSTRKVFRYKGYAIKCHLHSIGHTQSKNESCIYSKLKKRDLSKQLAEMFYVDEQIAIQKFYPAVPLINSQTYDLKLAEDNRVTDDLGKALDLIDKEYDGFDLKDSGNYGMDEDGLFFLIDYGMTKTLYEKEWVPLADKGILPQIYFEECWSCKEERELRIYGEHDLDRRCFACGKQ